MRPILQSLRPAQAAAALGVSAKALRLYERHGLVTPGRTRTGWRAYGPEAMARAADIVALRALGLGLAEIARLVGGDPDEREAGLAAHERRLHEQAGQVGAALDHLRALRAGWPPEPSVSTIGFPLPWPWDGAWFALQEVPPLSFITGPLGSGKTRFARALAAALPGAALLGLDRLTRAAPDCPIDGDAALAARVACTLAWLAENGAERSEALTALVTELERQAPRIVVVDMVEEGLGEATQVALMAHLRTRGSAKRALFLMTRSSSILDLDALRRDEAVILCPANHGPPIRVVPYPCGRGYEAAATCLATPAVRARSVGIVATRRHAP